MIEARRREGVPTCSRLILVTTLVDGNRRLINNNKQQQSTTTDPSPPLFMPLSDAPGLSAHALVVRRSVGRSGSQEGGSPQWGVVHEHTRRPTPVFMNTHKNNLNFNRPTWASGHVGADHQHLHNTRQLPPTGRVPWPAAAAPRKSILGF